MIIDFSKKKYALIVAGGIGKRMESEIPKQFLILNGKPVLMHTLEKFNKIKDLEIILALPYPNFDYWKTLCEQFSFSANYTLVEGGETRFHSVRNGLDKIDADSFVAIHDGVRPIVSEAIIKNSFEIAAQKGNAVSAVKVKDSIREMTLSGYTKNVSRKNFFLIQTPQTFQSSIIKEAYQKATHYNFTDDAGVAEEVLGTKINIIEGDYRNIKITTPEDLIIASAFLHPKMD